jgi:glycosyltransferase involved in cell wall biosynthesis
MKINILYIGPENFLPNVGLKNVELIYPTLFEPFSGCGLHLLHRQMNLPDYTNKLSSKYGLKFHCHHGNQVRDWIKAAVKIVHKYDIDILTNVFLGYHYGYIASKAARITRRKSVVRFAANEIRVRANMGAYEGLRGAIRRQTDLNREATAVRLAHEVIAMSPWEEKRLKQISNNPDKVTWCMRGVDLNQYAPSSSNNNAPATKFIFVGRNVETKGYKLVEKAAHELETSHPDIQFFFAGDFNPIQKPNIHYLGYLNVDQLKSLYKDADILILPSESEGFPNVVVEAMASGVPCIISKGYHQGFFEHKKNALLIDNSKTDLIKNILELYNNTSLMTSLRKGVRKFSMQNFDHTYWRHKYKKIMLSGVKSKPWIPDLSVNKENPKKKLRIAYIIRSRFGLMGTAASYMFAAKTNQKHVVLVLEMNPSTGSDDTPISYFDKKIRVINRFAHQEKMIGYQTTWILNQYKPDIVHLFHSDRCLKDILYLRSLNKKPKIVLDFRSPIFANKVSRSYIKLLNIYFFCHLFADKIITHSKLSLPGNLPLRFKKYTEIGPGINMSLFQTSSKKNKNAKKFIYIGSLNKNRKIHLLVDYFMKTTARLGYDLTLDIYGQGDTEHELHELINQRFFDRNVSLKGFISQEKLFSLLPKYDAGIAFIHVGPGASIFSRAPSLKSLEYAAAGLPVIASNTLGHLDYMNRFGFRFELFNNTFESLYNVIKQIVVQGFDENDVTNNLNCVKRFDWELITQTKLFPLYNNLAGTNS